MKLEQVPGILNTYHRLSVSKEFFNAMKSDLIPISQRMISMLNTYYDLPINDLLLQNVNRAQGLLEEVELLSNNLVVKRALRKSVRENKNLSNEDLISIVQNANESLIHTKDKMTHLVINFTNYLAQNSMADFSLDENIDQFSILPTKDSIKPIDSDFLILDKVWDDESESYKNFYYANADWLPRYVTELYSDENNFKPLFDENSHRLNLKFQKNYVSVQFYGHNALERIKHHFSRKISASSKSIINNPYPAYSSLKFVGDTIKGHSMLVDRADLFSGEPVFVYPDDVPFLEFEDDRLKVFYYPTIISSSGANDRELFFRPPAMSLWLLSQIPGIYYGKK